MLAHKSKLKVLIVYISPKLTHVSIYKAHLYQWTRCVAAMGSCQRSSRPTIHEDHNGLFHATLVSSWAID